MGRPIEEMTIGEIYEELNNRTDGVVMVTRRKITEDDHEPCVWYQDPYLSLGLLVAAANELMKSDEEVDAEPLEDSDGI